MTLFQNKEKRGGREREEEGRDFQFFVVVIVVV